MTLVKCIASASLLLASSGAFADSFAGKWQGPCENRGSHSVKFTLVNSEPDASGAGQMQKTKIYYRDLACEVYNRTGRATVQYVLGAEGEDGIRTLDIKMGSNWYYDIVKVTDDDRMIFGDTYSRSPDQRPTVLSAADRVHVRVEE